MQLAKKDDLVLPGNLRHGFEADFIPLIVVDFVGRGLCDDGGREQETKNKEVNYFRHSLVDIVP